MKKAPASDAELESDILAFIVRRYKGRVLDIDVARRALANLNHRLAMMHVEGTVRSLGSKG